MSRLRRLLLASLFALAFASEAGAAPVIRQIHIRGLESMDSESILRLLQSHPGEELDMAKVRTDQQTILAVGIFDPAQMSVLTEDQPDGTVDLIFAVRENPALSRIDIVGNVQERTSRIESLIDADVGERIPHQAERRAEQAIADHYRRQGHANVRVSARRIPQDDGTAVLSVVIDEGAVLRIGDVIIEGNEAISDRRIRWRMATRESGILGRNHYSDEVFEQDLMEIQRLYFSRGYIDASVERGDFRQSSEEGTIDPVIRVTEGPRYRFGTFSVRGNTLFTDLEITSKFDGLTGDWFDGNDLNRGTALVRTMYGDEGHINAVVEPQFDADPATGTVDVTIAVREGQRVRIGAVYLQRSQTAPDLEPPVSSFISGVAERLSPPVTDDTVRRVVTLREGDVYRHYEEVKTRERLRRLGIFNDVALERRPTSDPTVEDVYLTVDQQSTGFLTVGTGFGDEGGLFGFVGLTENNFGGEADQVRASVQLGTRSLNFDVSYFNRFLAETDLSLRLSAYHSQLQRREYDETRSGGAAEIGQPLGEYVQLFYRLRAEYVNLDLDGDASEATRDAMDPYWLALARLRLVEDRRDDIVWPTRGWLRGVSLEAGWADDWLVKLFGEFQYYRRLYRELIFAWNLQAGVIPRSVEDVAFGERFFLGGSNDLRGFRFRGAGPTDAENEDLFTGGSTRVLSQFELRFPIYQQLKGVTFFDVGSLGDDPFVLDQIRASVGAGIRFTLPGIGFIAVDLAQAVAAYGDDDRQTLHFTFQTDF